MSTVTDITGHRFGRWTVRNRAGAKIYTGGSTATWHCVCDCGTEKIVVGSSLRRGGSLSCGCFHIEAISGPPFPERFSENWTPEPNSGCWLWLGVVGTDGYSQIKIRPGKNISGHRASWELHRGPIPVGLFVLHKCDVPVCVNPEHLFLGTHDDNMRDMISKGRGHWQRTPVAAGA